MRFASVSTDGEKHTWSIILIKSCSMRFTRLTFASVCRFVCFQDWSRFNPEIRCFPYVFFKNCNISVLRNPKGVVEMQPMSSSGDILTLQQLSVSYLLELASQEWVNMAASIKPERSTNTAVRTGILRLRKALSKLTGASAGWTRWRRALPSDRDERKQPPWTPKQLRGATPRPFFSDSSLKTTSCSTAHRQGKNRFYLLVDQKRKKERRRRRKKKLPKKLMRH